MTPAHTRRKGFRLDMDEAIEGPERQEIPLLEERPEEDDGDT